MMQASLVQWDRAHLQWRVNDALVAAGIPIRVTLSADEAGERTWALETYGGDLDAALERIHLQQDRIARRFDRHGLHALSAPEAFFMYATQWLEWVVLRGGENQPDHAEIAELMEQWLAVHAALTNRFVN